VYGQVPELNWAFKRSGSESVDSIGTAMPSHRSCYAGPSKPVMPRLRWHSSSVDFPRCVQLALVGPSSSDEHSDVIEFGQYTYTAARSTNPLYPHPSSSNSQVRVDLLMLPLCLRTVRTRSLQSSASRIVLVGRFNCTGPPSHTTTEC
jgi:hypothetical protein